jgi:hypothetical protein
MDTTLKKSRFTPLVFAPNAPSIKKVGGISSRLMASP